MGRNVHEGRLIDSSHPLASFPLPCVWDDATTRADMAEVLRALFDLDVARDGLALCMARMGQLDQQQAVLLCLRRCEVDPLRQVLTFRVDGRPVVSFDQSMIEDFRLARHHESS